jgi:bifunctional enzyme CysN/CysC
MKKDILRIVTTGSVDDGKSTLIGRLLYETKCIPEDQYEAIKKASIRRGKDDVDLSLLLDGLADEREQGITIDVAYRYFETAKRKFIVADTPGHEQYTRNMVTGASNSDLAIILIDARHGVKTQSKRHGFINSLLGIQHLIVAINKMDLEYYSKNIYEAIVEIYKEFSEKLKIPNMTFIPISALCGDNVVQRSDKMPWYHGPTILEQIENICPTASHNNVDFRFPVQCVIRPDLNYRGFAGQVASGSIRVGETILSLPSKKKAKIESIDTFDASLKEAKNGQSVVLTLDQEIDTSRGDVFVRPANVPYIGSNFIAMMCWFDEKELNTNKTYLLKHTTQKVQAYINNVVVKIDVNTLHRMDRSSIGLNDIFKAEIETTSPLFFDSYINNKQTGSFILIDTDTNNTVAAGMIEKKKEYKETHKHLSGGAQTNYIGEKGIVYWFTGLSGSGKSTIAQELTKSIPGSVILDGDNVRTGLCKDLGFSLEDRKENLRRVAEVAKILSDNGIPVITSFITPLESDRQMVQEIIGEKYTEIYVKCSLEECERRDVKGLYAKARSGEIKQFTGISSPFEEPKKAHITINTEKEQTDDPIQKILKVQK